MSDQYQPQTNETNATDRGLFDYFGKKEEKPKEEVTKAEPEKLQRSGSSSSSSSSEEEVEEDGVKIKRKKKKGLKDKLKEKIPGHKDEETVAIPQSDYNNHDHHQTAAAGNGEGVHPEESKGFLEKIKEKFPGHQKDDTAAPAPAPAVIPAPPAANHCGPDEHCGGLHEQQEKKGFLEKIKEKLPGGHKDAEEPKKDY